MSAFKALQDVSNNFEAELRQVSDVLYSAKIGGTFEDVVSKKLRQLTLFSAKLKLLRAKPLALTMQITERPKTENTIKEYGDEAVCRVIEQLAVKFLTQSHAVKTLITAQNRMLNLEQIERKGQIIEALSEYKHQELQLRQLETELKVKEAEHAAVREEWDRELGELREIRNGHHSDEEIDTNNPLYLRLRTMVDKLEMMRWLLGRLVCARGHREWTGEPQRALAALKLARTPNTVAMFTDIQ